MGHVRLHRRQLRNPHNERLEEMSVALKLLQEKVGVEPDGAYGPNTARAITKHYGLSRVKAAHLLGQAGHESGGLS